jgi:hypothetical protein
MSSFMTPHFVCIASGWVRVDPEFLIHSEHKQAEATGVQEFEVRREFVLKFRMNVSEGEHRVQL